MKQKEKMIFVEFFYQITTKNIFHIIEISLTNSNNRIIIRIEKQKNY